MSEYKKGEYLIEKSSYKKTIYKIFSVDTTSLYLEDIDGSFNGKYDIEDVDKFCEPYNISLHNFKKYFLNEL